MRLVWLFYLGLASVAGAEPVPAKQDLLPYQRQLTGADAKRAEELEKQITKLDSDGEWAKAIPLAEEQLRLRRRGLGADHWQTRDAVRDLALYKQLAALPLQDRLAFQLANVQAAKGEEAIRKGQFIEAEQ